MKKTVFVWTQPKATGAKIRGKTTAYIDNTHLCSAALTSVQIKRLDINPYVPDIISHCNRNVKTLFQTSMLKHDRAVELHQTESDQQLVIIFTYYLNSLLV